MQTKHFPVATVSVIILNAIIFAIGLLSGEQTQIIQNYGFIPNHIFNAYDNGNNNNAQQNPLTSLMQPSEQQLLQLSSLPHSLTRLFSSMFIHVDIAHIAFNLFALAYLGGYTKSVNRKVILYSKNFINHDVSLH